MKLISQRSRINEAFYQNADTISNRFETRHYSPQKQQLNMNQQQTLRRNQSLSGQFTFYPINNEEHNTLSKQTTGIQRDKKQSIIANENTFQKQQIHNLIKQKSLAQKAYSPMSDIKNSFYTPQKSIEETFKFDGVLQNENTDQYNSQTAPVKDINPLLNTLRRSSTMIKAERKLSKQDLNLPQLNSNHISDSQQNSSIQTNQMQLSQLKEFVKQQQKDKETLNSRNHKKSFSLIDMKQMFQTNNKNDSSRNYSPLMVYNQDRNSSNVNQIQQYKARGSTTNLTDQLKFLSNSQLLLQSQNSNQRVRIPSLTSGITTNIYSNNDSQISLQQSIPQFSSTRINRKSLTQIKQIEKVEQILDNPFKMEQEAVTYNHNFTQKRKSRLFNVNMFRRSDPNIQYLQQSSKGNIGIEDSYSLSQNAIQSIPFIQQVFFKNDTTLQSFQRKPSYGNIIVQENGQTLNYRKSQSKINNIVQDKLQKEGDITPPSLVDLDENQSKQMLESNSQPLQMSSVELIAAYNQGDKKYQNQIQYKQDLLKTVQRKIPRFIKHCIEKSPEYYEIIIICNKDISFDQFCEKLGKFVSFCMDKTTVKLSSFNTIRMSLGLSECILTFLQQFFFENNLNKQYYNEFCERYREAYHSLNLKAGNLLLEIGGKRRVEAITSSIVQKVEKKYDISLKTKLNSIVDFSCYLLGGNKDAVEDCIRDFKNIVSTYGGVVNSSMCTNQDFFRIKYLLFSELFNDRDIPWKMKVLIINEFEKIRYKYFRDMIGIGDNISYYDLAQKIKQSMCELHWIRIGFISKKNDDRRNFLVELVRMIIEGEDGLAFKKYLESNYVSINTETIFMIESLVKGVLNQEKILPITTKKDFDYKFQKIKKLLGLENSYNYLISNLDLLQNEISKWIQQNNKINKVPQELARKYEDLEYFFLLLISSCEDNCMFHLSDSYYAQEILHIDLLQIQQQTKALKRVLISQHINAANTESAKYMTDIGMLISYIIKCFTDYKQF